MRPVNAVLSGTSTTRSHAERRASCGASRTCSATSWRRGRRRARRALRAPPPRRGPWRASSRVGERVARRRVRARPRRASPLPSARPRAEPGRCARALRYVIYDLRGSRPDATSRQSLIDVFGVVAERFSARVDARCATTSRSGSRPSCGQQLVAVGRARHGACPTTPAARAPTLLDLRVAVEALGARLAPAPLIEHAVAARLLAPASDALARRRASTAARIATLALRPRASTTSPASCLRARSRDVVVALDGDDLVAVDGRPRRAVPNLASAPLADRDRCDGDRALLASGAEADELLRATRARRVARAHRAPRSSGLGLGALEIALRVRDRARAVRRADRLVPGHPAHARRRRGRARRRAAARPQGGVGARRRPRRRRRARRDGLPVRGRAGAARRRTRRCTSTAATGSWRSTTSSSSTGAPRAGRSCSTRPSHEYAAARRPPVRARSSVARLTWTSLRRPQPSGSAPRCATLIAARFTDERPRAGARDRHHPRLGAAPGDGRPGLDPRRRSPRRWAAAGATPRSSPALFAELELAGAPYDGLSIVVMVSSVLAHVGNEMLQRRGAAHAAVAARRWCASATREPDSGSDVAAARTRAVRDGDGWRIDGQKMFTSVAEESEWIFLLTRTSPDGRQARGPHLLPRADGHARASSSRRCARSRASASNITFLDGVRIGDEWRVGDVDGGWQVMLVALSFERGLAGGVRDAERLLRVARGRWRERENADGERADRRSGRPASDWCGSRSTTRSPTCSPGRAAWVAASGRLPGTEGAAARAVRQRVVHAAPRAGRSISPGPKAWCSRTDRVGDLARVLRVLLPVRARHHPRRRHHRDPAQPHRATRPRPATRALRAASARAQLPGSLSICY